MNDGTKFDSAHKFGIAAVIFAIVTCFLPDVLAMLILDQTGIPRGGEFGEVVVTLVVGLGIVLACITAGILRGIETLGRHKPLHKLVWVGSITSSVIPVAITLLIIVKHKS
jgi:hypothetical protein